MKTKTNYVDNWPDFFCVTEQFLNEHPPGPLSLNMCMLLIDHIHYELNEGLQVRYHEFMPHIFALVKWLDQAAHLLKVQQKMEEENEKERA